MLISRQHGYFVTGDIISNAFVKRKMKILICKRWTVKDYYVPYVSDIYRIIPSFSFKCLADKIHFQKIPPFSAQMLTCA